MSNERVQHYCVGFAMDGLRVAFIRKNRPAWQAGLLNGIGGHVESGEDPRDAMVREFQEETGQTVPADEWHLFVRMTFPGAVIWFYKAHVGSDLLNALRSTTDEPVLVLGMHTSSPMIPNLRWLLPLAAYTADTYKPIEVTASMAEVIA